MSGNTTLKSGVLVSSHISVGSGGTIYNDTIISGGQDFLLSGTAVSTTVNSGGSEILGILPIGLGAAQAGIASGTTINFGGIQVTEGSVNFLSEPVFKAPSYSATVNAGGVILDHGVTSSSLINSGGTELVFSEGAAANTSVQSGGYLFVLPGAIVSGTSGSGSVISTGILYIDSPIGGTSEFLISGNNSVYQFETEYVLSSGNIPTGGVYFGGTLDVLAGTASSIDIYNGGVENLSGGVAYDTVILSGGTENIGGYGNLYSAVGANTTIESGGYLQLEVGGTLTGSLVFEGSGSQLYFDDLAGNLGIPWVTSDTIPVIDGFGTGDEIEISNMSVSSASVSNGTLYLDENNGNGGLALSFGNSSSDQFVITTTGGELIIEGSTLGNSNVPVLDVACFLKGTNILTPTGNMPVEKLKIGDMVETYNGEKKPIKWIGYSHYVNLGHDGRLELSPILICKDAISDDIPKRDLYLSPGHAVVINKKLIHAARLINGKTIMQDFNVSEINYYHIELEQHEVILAENCPVETFMDEYFRNQFQNSNEFYSLYPDERAADQPCLPQLFDGFELFDIQRGLRRRARLPEPKEDNGPLRGCIDVANNEFCRGWAQSLSSPDVPVCLIVTVSGQYAGHVLANSYRQDLRDAGIGNGFHGFKLAFPANMYGVIEVRSATDGQSIKFGSKTE